MLTIKDFDCSANNIFRFQYKLNDALYNSQVIFANKGACPDGRFEEFIPQINDTLEWLNTNTIAIRAWTKKMLPPDADLKSFDSSIIYSFSLMYKNIDILELHVSFGHLVEVEYDGMEDVWDYIIYVTSTIIDKRVVAIHVVNP